jgi:Competence protein J (ComJ)
METLLGKARIFASHYQFVVCDDPAGFSDDENWTDEKVARGFAGSARFRMIGTTADLNDHWIELVATDTPPSAHDWQRITCAPFRCETGQVHVMSIIDAEPAMSAAIGAGDYTLYAAAQNMGVDPDDRGEGGEWYRVFLVPLKT